MRMEGVTFQLVPPHLHRTNAAEHVIQTFKYHFLAYLSTCNPYFPLHLWDRLLPQAMLTLKLIHPSRINPCLSSKAQLNCAFDFNKTPLAHHGTKVLIFKTSATRCTWLPHFIRSGILSLPPNTTAVVAFMFQRLLPSASPKPCNSSCTNVSLLHPPQWM